MLGSSVVMQALHEVRVGQEGCPGVVCGAGGKCWGKSGGQGAWTAKAGHDCWDTWAQWAADI